MVSRWIKTARRNLQGDKGNNGGAGRLEADCAAVGPSYGRGSGRFRKKLIVLFETIFGPGRGGDRHCEERSDGPVIFLRICCGFVIH